MINSLSAANIAFNMSSSKFAWFPSLLSVFSNSFKLRKKCLLLQIVKKCTIKQLLNSVFSLMLWQVTQTLILISHDIMLNLIQKLLNTELM